MSGRGRHVLWIIVGAGLLGRLVLDFATYGQAYDIDSFEIVRGALADDALHVYSVANPPDRANVFRWPYPPGFFPFIALTDVTAGVTGLRFHHLIQVPSILADAAIALLVQWYLGRRGAGERVRLAAAALVMFGPSFWVISGYHGQLDSVAILPAVLALVLWEKDVRRRALVAGALIGAAAALKTVPIVMVLALLPAVRSRREAVALIGAAVAVPALALLPFYAADPEGVKRMTDYGGAPGAGGLSIVLQPELARAWLTGLVDYNGLTQLLADHQTLWNLILLGGVGAFLLRARPQPAVAATLVWLVVLAFGRAFFFQYLVWALPFFLMAGYLRSTAALQAVMLVPAYLFYRGPWKSDAVVVVYVAFMLVAWVGLVVGLVRVGRTALASGEPGRSATGWPPWLSSAGRRLGLDRVELGILGALLLWSLYPLAVLVRHAGRTGQVLTGPTGLIPGDELQYLAWVREGAEHGLVSNAWDLETSSRVFLHPLFLPAGLVGRLIDSYAVGLMSLKLVSVAVLFAGFALYVRRMVRDEARVRHVTLAVALFFVTPLAAFGWWAKVDERGELYDIAGETFAAGSVWGYPPTGIAIGLIPLALLAAERGLAGAWSWLAAAGAAGALAAWLHPWQGEVTLLLLGVMGVVVLRRDRAGALRLALPMAMTVAPIAYYFLLSRADPAWAFAAGVNEVSRYPLWALAAGLLPLVVLVPWAWRARDVDPWRDPQEAALWLWLPAALLVYLVLSPSVPAHALEGISLPAAVLAARALRSLRVPAPVVAAAALVVTLPGLVWFADELRKLVHSDTQPALILSDERRALEVVEASPREGGVLAPPFLGLAVPGETGRRTWVGHPTWTPDYWNRVVLGERMFSARPGRDRPLSPAEARALVRSSGAAFVVSDCRGRRDLRAALAPIATARRVGCATVYEVRQAPQG